jgi:alkylated DNA repair dioxygenase AlkB
LSQLDLLGLSQNNENLLPTGGEAFYYQNKFSSPLELFEKLDQEIKWRQDEITLYGKTHPIPRLQAFYGDEGLKYAYSNIKLTANIWTPTLKEILTIVSLEAGENFNCVLINKYRDGNDYAAWHSDDEPELGKNPVIASVSLGAERSFHLKHKTDKGVEQVKINLEDGSLLIMKGQCQHQWKHQLAKTAKKIGPRINLTFRKISYKQAL